MISCAAGGMTSVAVGCSDLFGHMCFAPSYLHAGFTLDE
jgi:hypothetical protein